MKDVAPKFRGAFACIGSDGEIHQVRAWVNGDGVLSLFMETDGREVTRSSLGNYFVADRAGVGALFLFCDHPDAP